jgi:hypothetical protein
VTVKRHWFGVTDFILDETRTYTLMDCDLDIHWMEILDQIQGEILEKVEK